MKDSGPMMEVRESGNADLREEVSFGGFTVGAALLLKASLSKEPASSNTVVGWSVLPHLQGCTRNRWINADAPTLLDRSEARDYTSEVEKNPLNPSRLSIFLMLMYLVNLVLGINLNRLFI